MELGGIRDEERTAWIQYVYRDENGQEVKTDVEVLFKYITPESLNIIGEKAKKKVWVNHQEHRELDPIKHHQIIGREVVRGWRKFVYGEKSTGAGFTDNGEPFLYSVENCDLLMKTDFNFIKFVNDNCTEMSYFIKKKQEGIKKKSSSMETG